MGMLEQISQGTISGQNRGMQGEVLGRPLLPRRVEQAVRQQVAIQYGQSIVAAARVEKVRNAAWHARCALDDLESEVNSYRQNLVVDAAALAFVDIVRAVGRA